MRHSRFMGPKGSYTPNEGKTWAELAVRMNREMQEQGLSRRTYTGNMLYEHWYQTVKKNGWTENRHQMLADSARAARRGAGQQSRSRSKKVKQRANHTSSSALVTGESNRPSIDPTQSPNEAVSPQINMNSQRNASDRPQMGRVSASGSASTQTPAANMAMAPRNHPGRPINYGVTPNNRYRPYFPSRRPNPTAAETTAMYRRYHHPSQPERQRSRSAREYEAHGNPVAATALRQSLQGRERQLMVIRDPTPEDDGHSLFIQQAQPRFNGGPLTPRATPMEMSARGISRGTMELDAAHTMAMFRTQEMNTLHGTPAPPQRHAAVDRRPLYQARPYENDHQRYSPAPGTAPEDTLAPIISRRI